MFDACQTLRDAQPEWAAAGVEARAATMEAWARALQAAKPELMEALVEDTGRIPESELEFGAVTESCT